MPFTTLRKETKDPRTPKVPVEEPPTDPRKRETPPVKEPNEDPNNDEQPSRPDTYM